MKLQNDLELYTVDKQLEQTCNKLRERLQRVLD